jgi:hypothetical protein
VTGLLAVPLTHVTCLVSFWSHFPTSELAACLICLVRESSVSVTIDFREQGTDCWIDFSCAERLWLDSVVLHLRKAASKAEAIGAGLG